MFFSFAKTFCSSNELKILGFFVYNSLTVGIKRKVSSKNCESVAKNFSHSHIPRIHFNMLFNLNNCLVALIFHLFLHIVLKFKVINCTVMPSNKVFAAKMLKFNP